MTQFTEQDWLDDNEQKKVFEMEVECSLAQSKKRWKEIIINLPADELLEAVNDEIKAATRWFESSINSDGIVFKASEKELLEAKRGIIPDLSDLKGSQYKEIKENYDLMKKGKDFKVTYFCLTSGRRAAWLYLKYLKKFKSSLNDDKLKDSPDDELYYEGLELENKTTLLKLRFRKDIQNPLIEDLGRYCPGYEESLEKLIKGKAINEKIVLSSSQKVLGDMFYRIYENKYVLNSDKKEFIAWIISNFQYSRKGKGGEFKSMHFNYSSFIKAFVHSRSSAIKSNDRILLDLLPDKV